jgi:uncharacterized phage protein gp47/JayE
MQIEAFGPDNVLRGVVDFTTSIPSRFFSGIVDASVVDIQVSINSAPYSSDPAIVLFTGESWTCPNPSAEPLGFTLLPGLNTILVRGITINGGFTSPVVIRVNLVGESSIGVVATAPTAISVEQRDDSVLVGTESDVPAGLVGFNFYASLFPGGGASGYSRLNVLPVSAGVEVRKSRDFRVIDVDAVVAVDGDGNPVADPLFWGIRIEQEDMEGNIYQTDLNQMYEIPETARRIQLRAVLSEVRTPRVFSFEHNRSATPRSNPPTIPNGAFTSVPSTQSLYYVVTSTYYDTTRNLEYESAYSVEVVAHPLSITTAIASLPIPSRQTIVDQFISSVYRSNPQIKVEAGSVLRDTVIDPFANESDRIRVVLDFFYRARTPALLLQVDDPNSTGTSIAVSDSTYKLAVKSAFYLSSDGETQALFDSAFDAYAQNLNVFRRLGSYSVGEVTFSTRTRPTTSAIFPVGSVVSAGGVQFVTTRFAVIPFESVASYYNPVTDTYEVTVTVQAVLIGPQGNVAAGQIRTLVTPIPGFTVTNRASMFGGTSLESNLSLVTRATNRIASVDTSTKRGYMQIAADVPGVLSVEVVAAGDPLMQRDLDASGQHKGGKVDIWIQGINPAVVTNTFAFGYDLAQNVQFVISGNVNAYKFQAVDITLSPLNPILEMVDIPEAGWEFVNASTGEIFDLSGYTITSFNTIQLDTNRPQPQITLTDVLLGTYRRRVGNRFVFPRQPVNVVVSVVGSESGNLPPDAYTLIRPSSPLDYGRSTLAGDFLEINGATNSTGDMVPTGAVVQVQNEPHVMVGTYPEPLDNLGAIFYTIEVWDVERTTQYRGPLDPSGNPDYTIDLGDSVVPVAIRRVPSGQILDGQQVVVDYLHDENFVVSYQINQVVTVTQERVDQNKSATADVLVKDAIRVPLDIEATVILDRGRSRSEVDTALRTNFANFFANRRLDDAVRQSDIIGVIEQTSGVSYCIVPLSKLVRQTGSTVLQEFLSTDGPGESTSLLSISTSRAVVYILNQQLSSATTNGGGPRGDFKGVFKDDSAMLLLDSTQLYSRIGDAPDQAYIIGNDGAIINGFTDDATLISRGFTTPMSIQARRRALTSNKVLVSLPLGTSPANSVYAVTYIVGLDSGAKDIDASPAEYFVQGNLTFTYDEDR